MTHHRYDWWDDAVAEGIRRWQTYGMRCRVVRRNEHWYVFVAEIR